MVVGRRWHHDARVADTYIRRALLYLVRAQASYTCYGRPVALYSTLYAVYMAP